MSILLRQNWTGVNPTHGGLEHIRHDTRLTVAFNFTSLNNALSRWAKLSEWGVALCDAQHVTFLPFRYLLRTPD